MGQDGGCQQVAVDGPDAGKSNHPERLFTEAHGAVDKVSSFALTGAIEIIQSVLHQANSSIAREEREDACLDLSDRVEDWKSLRMETFGDLVLFGTFTVLKGDGGGKDQEKEVGLQSASHPDCLPWRRRKPNHG